MTIPREEAVIREGWLLKEGGASKSRWQSRWFILKGRTLSWYNKAEDSSPQGSVAMADVQDVSQIGEHSNKKYCISLVTTKANSKKVYYLAAETENHMREWFGALQSQWLGDKAGGMRLVKYATAEVFLTQGVRVTGDVNYGILSTISSRVAPERKRRDGLGWFCDCSITLSAVLNLFTEYGWTPERVYRSTSTTGNDSTLHPVIRVIFSKSPQQEAVVGGTNRDTRQLESSTALLRSGVFDTVTVSSQRVGLALPPGTQSLEGTDDELISLMQEFGIPLSLLLVPSDN